jgi:hypothetical protein
MLNAQKRRNRVNLVAFSAESIERPKVLDVIVAKHVEVSIVGKNAEIRRAGRVPLSIEFANVKEPVTNSKAQRMLIGAMPCVTFDANLSHFRTLAEVSLFRVYLATRNYVRAERAPSAEPCSGDPCLRSSQAPLGRRVRSWFTFDLAAPIVALRQDTTSVVP